MVGRCFKDLFLLPVYISSVRHLSASGRQCACLVPRPGGELVSDGEPVSALPSTNSVLPGCHEATIKTKYKRSKRTENNRKQQNKEKNKVRLMACRLLGSSLSLSRSRYLLLVRNSVISLLLLLGNHRSTLCLHMPSGLLFMALFVPRVGLGPGGGFQRIGSPALWGQYRSLVLGNPKRWPKSQMKSYWNARSIRQGECILTLWLDAIPYDIIAVH